MTPAAAEDPDGPWDDLANAWRAAFGAPGRAASGMMLDAHPGADRDTVELLEYAARAAELSDPEERNDETF